METDERSVVGDHSSNGPASTAAAAVTSSTNMDEPSEFSVLILGDGNFSFSLALAQLLSKQLDVADVNPAVLLSTCTLEDNQAVDFLLLKELASLWGSKKTLRLRCTSFDSREELLSKYHDCPGIFKQLEAYQNVVVEHGINAWELPEQYPGQSFDAIVWNHPHLGVEDFRLHRFLMAHFLFSAGSCLKPDGFVSVSLVVGQEERWALDAQAERAQLAKLSETPFLDYTFPGYICKRNQTGRSFKNVHTQKHTGHAMASKTHRYARSTTCDKLAPLIEQFNKSQEDDAQSAECSTVEIDEPLVVEVGKPKEPVFLCQQCGKELRSARALKSHTIQVHELKQFGADWKPTGRPQKFSCPDCPKKFHDEEALWQHRVAKHSFDRDIGAKKHFLTDSEVAHGGEEVKFIGCPVCSQAVPERWGMAQHLETLKPLVGLNAKCIMCEKTFIEHRALRQHLNFCKLLNAKEEVDLDLQVPEAVTARMYHPAETQAPSVPLLGPKDDEVAQPSETALNPTC